VSIFKDFEIDIVVDAVRRRKVDFLTLLLLTLTDLLSYIYHVV